MEELHDRKPRNCYKKTGRRGASCRAHRVDGPFAFGGDIFSFHDYGKPDQRDNAGQIAVGSSCPVRFGARFERSSPRRLCVAGLGFGRRALVQRISGRSQIAEQGEHFRCAFPFALQRPSRCSAIPLVLCQGQRRKSPGPLCDRGRRRSLENKRQHRFSNDGQRTK